MLFGCIGVMAVSAVVDQTNLSPIPIDVDGKRERWISRQKIAVIGAPLSLCVNSSLLLAPSSQSQSQPLSKRECLLVAVARTPRLLKVSRRS